MKNNLFIYIVILISFTTFSCEDEKDTTGPELSIVSPKNNSTLEDVITIQVNTSDKSGIQNVDFYIDSINVFSDSTSPYQYEWNTINASDREHFIKVISYDIHGNFTESEIITVNVKNPVSIAIKVISYGYNTPIASANLSVDDSVNFSSNSNGEFNFDLFKGRYSIIIKHETHIDKKFNLNVEPTNSLRTLTMYYNPWDSIGVFDTPVDLSGQFSHTFVAAHDNIVYYSTHNNGGFSEFARSFNVSNGEVDEIPTNGLLCACGYSARWIGAPNGKLYYIISQGAAFNTQSNSWENVNVPNERGRGEPSVTVIGDELVFVGGRGYLETVHSYNYSTNEWKSLANFPHKVEGTGLVSYNNVLYSFGGYDGSNIIKKIYSYNKDSDKWSLFQDNVPLEFSSYNRFPVLIGDTVYFIRHRLKYNFVNNNWEEDYNASKANGFTSNTFKIVQSTNGSIYAVGYKENKITVFSYNPKI